MSIKYFIIFLLLIIVLYLYNKIKTYEKLEHFDDNIINQLASIINGDKVILNNVEINGTLNCNGDVNVSNDKTLTAQNLKTYNIQSNNNMLDLHGNVHIFDTALIDKSLESTNIKTRYLTSTKDNRIDIPGLYVLNTLYTKDIQPLLWDTSNKDTINVNGNMFIKNDKTLTASNLNTRFVHSTAGDNSWVDFLSNVNNRGETTKIEKKLNYQGSNISKTEKIMAGKQKWLSY